MSLWPPNHLLMKKSFLQVASIALLGNLLGKGLNYGFNIVIANGLGPDALGLFAFGLVVVRIASIPTRAGLDQAAQKFIPIYKNSGDKNTLTGIVLLCLLTPLILGSILATILYLNRKHIFQIIGVEFGYTVSLFILGLPLVGFLRVSVYATKGFKETKYAVLSKNILQSGLAFILAAAGAFIFDDLQFVVIGYLVSLAVGGLVATYFLYRQGGLQLIRPNFPFRSVFSFSIPLTLVAVSSQLIAWSDVLFLGLYVPSAELGWYQAAYQTSILLPIVLHAANAIFPSFASDLYDAGELERLQQAFTAVTKWVTYLSVLGCIFLITYASNILALFGTVTSSAITALGILAVAQTITATTGPVGYLLMMTGYERIETANTLLVAGLNIILNIILIQQYGIIGAAIATGISLALYNILELAEVYYLLGFIPYSRNYLGNIGPSSIAILVIFMGTYLPIGGILQVCIVGTAALITFAIGIFVVGFDESDQFLLRSL